MLEEKGFQGIITSQKYDSQQVVLTIKHESTDKVQTLLFDLADLQESPNTKVCFEVPAWEKIQFEFNQKVEINLDQDAVKFNGLLETVTVSKKAIEDGFVYSYILKVIKNINPEQDSLIGTNYLKTKEENEEGKKVYVLYNFTLKDI